MNRSYIPQDIHLAGLLGCSQQFSKLAFHTSLVLNTKKKKKKEKTTLVCFQKQNRKYHSIKWLQSEFLRELSCQLIGTNHPRCYHFEFCTWLSMVSSLQHRGYLKSVPIWGFLLIQSYFGESGFALMNSESLIQRELRCPLDSA